MAKGIFPFLYVYVIGGNVGFSNLDEMLGRKRYLPPVLLGRAARVLPTTWINGKFKLQNVIIKHACRRMLFIACACFALTDNVLNRHVKKSAMPHAHTTNSQYQEN
jgi:hypothetical protein